jgi:hypothetical protein
MPLVRAKRNSAQHSFPWVPDQSHKRLRPRILAALAIITVFQMAPTPPRQTPQEPRPITKTIENKTNSNKKVSTPATIQNTEPSTGESKDGKRVASGDEQKHIVVERLPEKDIWDKSYIILTGLLVLIGAFSFVCIYYQAVQTKKATEAMERSTGITIEVERGRVFIFWDQVAHSDLSPTGIHDGSLAHYFNWACANTGKTEVQLTGLWCRFIAVDKLENLPPKPEYDSSRERTYDGEPLQPGAKQRQTEWFAVPLETDLPFAEMQEKHRSGRCFLYAYGYARYRDVWRNPHITRFGVVRVIKRSIAEDYWTVAGPAEYNRSE